MAVTKKQKKVVKKPLPAKKKAPARKVVSAAKKAVAKPKVKPAVLPTGAAPKSNTNMIIIGSLVAVAGLGVFMFMRRR